MGPGVVEDAVMCACACVICSYCSRSSPLQRGVHRTPPLTFSAASIMRRERHESVMSSAMMNVHTQDRQWSVMLRFAQHDMTGFDREHSSWRLFSESLSVSHPTLVL